MRNTMIKLVDIILMISIIIVVVIAGLAGSQQGGVTAMIYAFGAFVLMSFINALWFCISGIYHNSKVLADQARRSL